MQETWVQSLGREDPLEEAWQRTPVLLSEESHGQRSLVGYSPYHLFCLGTIHLIKKASDDSVLAKQ